MKEFRILVVVVAAVCLLAGCGGKKVAVPDGVEAYCTDDAKETGDIGDVFSSVELIPLEFTGEYYPYNVNRVQVVDSLILVYDYHNRLTVFEKDGKYVSSSAEKFGQGPEEFAICLGFGWNPYTRLIEIIGYSKIMFYDKEFNYVRSCKAPNKPGTQILEYIHDLSPTRHVLLTNDTEEAKIFLFDSEKGEIVRESNYREWTKGGGASSQRKRFFSLPDGNIYCMPRRVNDKILRLQPDSLTFESVVRILPGKNALSPAELDEMVSSNEGFDRIIDMDKAWPYRMMFNTNKIFHEVSIGRSYFTKWHLVVDRQSGDMRKLQNFDGESRIFPQIDDMDEEYAYSVIEKEELAKSPRLLLDKAEKKDSILGAIEDEILIVLKYRIRD